MRRKKHGAERIAACADLLYSMSGDISSAFADASKPLYLEIGCGKGGFACELASANPDFNVLALERISDVACIALERAKACADKRPDNLRFMIADARFLGDYLPEHSVCRIYLNFSDPWPKKGYLKRRLTHIEFLEIYRRLLVPGGCLIQKTDNEGFFDFSLEQFEAAGLKTEYLTRDLHASEYIEGNIMTEYEAAFVSQGKPICSAKVLF